MSFDAGAVVGKMVMDKGDWDSGVQKVQTDIQNLGQKVYNLGQSFTSVSRNLGMMSRNLIYFGAGMLTPLIATFKSVANYSYGVNTEIRKLNDSFKNFRIEIATAMIPTVRQFNNIFSQFVKWFKDLPDDMKQSVINTILVAGAILVLVGTLGTAIANLLRLLGASFKLIGMAMSASFSSPISLIVAGIGVIVLAMWKWEGVSTFVCNVIELALRDVLVGLKTLKTAWQEFTVWLWKTAIPSMETFLKGFANKIIEQKWIPSGLKAKLTDFLARDLIAPMDNAVKDVATILDDLTIEAGNSLDDLEKEVAGMDNLFSKTLEGKQGGFAEWVDNLKTALKDGYAGLVKFWEDLQNGQKGYIDTSKSVFEEFFNGLKEGWASVYADMQNWFNFGKQVATDFIMGMKTLFSDFFYNVFMGQLKDAQQAFAEFGKACLRIISEVISQLIVAYIVKSLIGGGNIPGLPTNVIEASNAGGGGRQTGIERVPHTGVFRLEEGEQVVPRYATTRPKNEPMQILNVITPEAVAMAMAGKAGQNVIINIINTDSLRNGMTRREIYRR